MLFAGWRWALGERVQMSLSAGECVPSVACGDLEPVVAYSVGDLRGPSWFFVVSSTSASGGSSLVPVTAQDDAQPAG